MTQLQDLGQVCPHSEFKLATFVNIGNVISLWPHHQLKSGYYCPEICNIAAVDNLLMYISGEPIKVVGEIPVTAT